MIDARKLREQFIQQAEKVIIGQNRNLMLSLVCFIANGHLLIEDLPGMGKTTMVKAISKLLGLKMQRIQATSDLLPQDVLGNSIYKQSTESFELIQGPIFSELVFVDELNRASPKTQSAFLEGMEERRVTIDGQPLPLPNPFFLVATQNPSSQIGTHFLPESQLDRFLFVLFLGVPDRETEKKLLLNGDPGSLIEDLSPICSVTELLSIQGQVEKVFTSDEVIAYLLDLAKVVRDAGVAFSPRASKQMLNAARSVALLDGRDFVTPEDIKFVAPNLLAHRLASSEKRKISSAVLKATSLLEKVAIA